MSHRQEGIEAWQAVWDGMRGTTLRHERTAQWLAMGVRAPVRAARDQVMYGMYVWDRSWVVEHVKHCCHRQFRAKRPSARERVRACERTHQAFEGAVTYARELIEPSRES
jgi:hypothetical protein